MHNDDLHYLLSLERIHQLKARYCRFIDTKQWQRMPSLFTGDCRMGAKQATADWLDNI